MADIMTDIDDLVVQHVHYRCYAFAFLPSFKEVKGQFDAIVAIVIMIIRLIAVRRATITGAKP